MKHVNWRLNILGGYAKNLGASKEVSELTGMGTNIDQTLTGVIGLSRSWSHLKFRLEYNTTTAWYGTNNKKGEVKNTQAVTNHRLMFTTQYSF